MPEKRTLFWGLVNTILIIAIPVCIFRWIFRTTVGWNLRRRSAARKNLISARVKLEESQSQLRERCSPKSDDGEWEKVEKYAVGSAANGGEAEDEWEGIIGFFHPFCNAGGGGERVLWAAIKATQKRWPKAICVVYTGDHDTGKEEMLAKVENRFNIKLHPPTVVFLYLSTRYYVLSSTYSRFTLLGQSLGSLILAYDAFSLLVPDIFIDTMGYAFALAFSKFFFPAIPTGAYVHYPTISTDMLSSLNDTTPSRNQGLNAGTGKGLRGSFKKRYWHLFAKLYSRVGGKVDVVMTNSSWTASHIRTLWGPARTARRKPHPVTVVFPPCAVDDIVQSIPLTKESEKHREQTILYIAQFRPEKNHSLLLRSFARFLSSSSLPEKQKENFKLILIGSVRDSSDATRVYDLRLLAHELHITGQTTFITDASFPTILKHLGTASVGANCMWNEHFGIGVVEYQAAGLISVVNDSGGPKMDIVVPRREGGRTDGGVGGRGREGDAEEASAETGFKASTENDYAEAFSKAFAMTDEEKLAMRRRARAGAAAFGEEAFEKSWIGEVGRLVEMQGG